MWIKDIEGFLRYTDIPVGHGVKAIKIQDCDDSQFATTVELHQGKHIQLEDRKDLRVAKSYIESGDYFKSED